MRYFVYSGHDLTVSYEWCDEKGCVLGTVRPKSPPVVEADNLDEAENQEKAYLTREPMAFLYLTDAEGHVYKTIWDERLHARAALREKTVFMTIALLVFLGSAILGTAFAGFVVWGLCCFVAVSVLYGFLVGSHFFNEVEAALVCELLLIPTLLIIRICLRS